MAKPSAYVLKLQAQRKLAEFQEAYMKWSRYIAETALADAKDDKELTYTKHKIDGLLKEALGEEFFLPWEERYRL